MPVHLDNHCEVIARRREEVLRIEVGTFILQAVDL
jgi:hypothetical protein